MALLRQALWGGVEQQRLSVGSSVMQGNARTYATFGCSLVMEKKPKDCLNHQCIGGGWVPAARLSSPGFGVCFLNGTTWLIPICYTSVISKWTEWLKHAHEAQLGLAAVAFVQKNKYHKSALFCFVFLSEDFFISKQGACRIIKLKQQNIQETCSCLHCVH